MLARTQPACTPCALTPQKAVLCMRTSIVHSVGGAKEVVDAGCLNVYVLLCRALRSWSLNYKNPGVAPNCSRLQHRRCVAGLWRQRSFFM